MASPLLIPLLAASAQAACPDFDQQLDWAQDELLEVNDRAALSALRQAEEALACGPERDPTQVARFFLLDGAVAQLQGDQSAASESFAAAARADRDTWIPALGPQLKRQLEEAAAASAPVGSLDVEAAKGWVVLLDGTPAVFPSQVASGLHVVQVVGDGEAGFGRVIRVNAGEDQVVASGLAARQAAPTPPAPAPVVAAPEPSKSPISLSAGLGFSTALGQPLSGVRDDGSTVAEPATKLTVPVELGVVLRLDGLWIRPTLGLAPLIGGRFLFATDEGAGAAGFALEAALSAGVGAGPVDVGGLVGLAYPGRIALRGLAGLPLGDTPLFAELRAGLNLATAGRIEPAFGAVISARLP